jgi:glycosyltransferase involved in cell wall biosynthesis
MSDDVKKIGVDIVQPIVPEFRVALFEGLARDSDLDVSVQASEKFISGSASVAMSMPSYTLAHPVVRLFRTPLIWQKKLSLIKAKGRGDVLVVCGDIAHLSNYALILKAKLRGVGVIWWGHHRTAYGKPFKIKVRLAVTRFFADVVLCYTDGGIHYLESNGFRGGSVFATGNTIDQVPIEDASAHWTDSRLKEFQLEHGLVGTKVVLFCSMLRRKTQLDVLIRAMASKSLKSEKILLIVIGDGEMRGKYEEIATRVGVGDRIRWLGVIHDQNALAPWFMSARAFVYPGAIGLSLIHAFSYGLPVLTHENVENQMPEFEALIPGENGLVFREGDPDSLADQLTSLIQSDLLFLRLSAQAKKTAREEYSMSRMIARFKEAILACSRTSLSKDA